MREVSFLFEKRTDLALEARELWQESAGKTTRLPGVKARETKLQGYPLTRVDILDEAGKQALGATARWTSPPSGSGATDFSTGPCRRRGSSSGSCCRSRGPFW